MSNTIFEVPQEERRGKIANAKTSIGNVLRVIVKPLACLSYDVLKIIIYPDRIDLKNANTIVNRVEQVDNKIFSRESGKTDHMLYNAFEGGRTKFMWQCTPCLSRLFSFRSTEEKDRID